MSRHDQDGQAPSLSISGARVADRSTDELIGLCRGILADGVIADSEATYLLAWLDSNRAAAEQWPGSVIYDRIGRMLEDGVLDADEQSELLDLLNEATGEGIPVNDAAAAYTTTLPLSDPAPAIDFLDRVFVLTGKFASGSRKECQEQVRDLGGSVKSSPSVRTDFLVVGAVGSRDWIHSTHGRKIETAVDLRDKGAKIAIVSEEQWLEAVKAEIEKWNRP